MYYLLLTLNTKPFYSEISLNSSWKLKNNIGFHVHPHLSSSGKTVRTHTKNLMAKLDATNSAGAVSRAYELGLLRA